jgi:hypothetical protein
LNGKVKLEFSQDVLSPNDVIAIEDQNALHPSSPDSPGIFFSLDKYTSAISNDKLTSSTDKTEPLTRGEAKFDEAVKLTVSLDGVADLDKLTADKTPVLITHDESTDTWVRLPLDEIDQKANTVSAQIKHFSGWGITFGRLWPQDGANVLLFDNATPSLFTGRSNFSIPIWTPPGRNGMAPSLSLDYSSATVDGIVGSVQSPWTGIGWSLDTVQITRKITTGDCTNYCNNDYFGFENKFTLLFNGTGGELIEDPSILGRYHTKNESFLYIQLHNIPNDMVALNNWR